ncbi:MAG: hypothetical protein IT462_09910 [Planctomycetes bacterium]|nr:hypothetical protein [Planctomycetota bacterium]
MKTNVIIAVLLIAVAAGGITVWWFNRPLPPANNTPAKPHETLTIEGLVAMLKAMDANGDEVISEAEFGTSYGETVKDDKKPFVIHAGPDKPQFTTKEAYAHFDMNHSGEIDAEDLYMIQNFKTWTALERIFAKGLTPRKFFNTVVELNSMGLAWTEEEIAAVRENLLPFQGQFFARRYFNDWGVITLKDGKQAEGFLYKGDSSEQSKADSLKPGDVRLLGAGARLSFHGKDSIMNVEAKSDHPYSRLARKLKDPAFTPDDKAANLALARELAKDGLKLEAQRMYKRVLILERENAEALEYLDLKVKKDSVEYEPK